VSARPQLENYLLWWLEQQHLHQSPRQLRAAADDVFADLPDEPWMEDGLCGRSPMPDAWFPGKDWRDPNTQAAMQVCHRCPVHRPCLDYAMTHDVEGIWGGTTTQQRRQLKRARAKEATA
jgi:WhiB family redox-sensing transcriptional regulator